MPGQDESNLLGVMVDGAEPHGQDGSAGEELVEDPLVGSEPLLQPFDIVDVGLELLLVEVADPDFADHGGQVLVRHELGAMGGVDPGRGRHGALARRHDAVGVQPPLAGTTAARWS